MALRYDLHIHSCLSPCAEDDMTPANLAGFAKLAGADLIAVTDHNSARNLPAVQTVCAAYGLRLLPGIEVNTAEEIHLLCYFPTVADALAYGEALYAALPAFPYDEQIWGRQLVMDENDEVTGTVEKLLTGAVSWSLAEAKRRCEAVGGVAVPAHIDADSYSVLSVLGLFPDDLGFAAVEVHLPQKLPGLIGRGFVPSGLEVLHSSDAHQLADVAADPWQLAEDSVLQKLL